MRQHTNALFPAIVQERIPYEPFTGIVDPDEVDWCLWLAWSFIVACGAYYFSGSRWCALLVEVAKRNWRESVAQHEHNQ